MASRLDRVKSLLSKHSSFKEKQKTISFKKHRERVKDWCTFYRRNWDIYAEEELGIELKFFQRIAIYLIGISDIFFFFCSRGNSKILLGLDEV